MNVRHEGNVREPGRGELRADLLEAPGGRDIGAVTRTISQPTSASAIDCRTVAATSCVSLVVIDCTRMGLVPPTPTPPIMTSLVGRRTVRKREAQ